MVVLCVGGYAGVRLIGSLAINLLAALPGPGSQRQICELRETPANKSEEQQVGGFAYVAVWRY